MEGDDVSRGRHHRGLFAGKDSRLRQMEAIREQQERLARLHFDVGAEQVLCVHYPFTFSLFLFSILSIVPSLLLIYLFHLSILLHCHIVAFVP